MVGKGLMGKKGEVGKGLMGKKGEVDCPREVYILVLVDVEGTQLGHDTVTEQLNCRAAPFTT